MLISLDKSLDCGQAFRWRKIGTCWFGIVRGNLIELEQRADGQIATNLDIQEYNSLKQYLDLYGDYDGLFKLDLSNDKFAMDSLRAGLGIKILNQELWEVIVSFIIQQRNNIPKIKTCIEKLCDVAGSPVKIQGKLWGISSLQELKSQLSLKAFPTPMQIVEHEEEIRKNCQLGYRADYIIELAKAIGNNLDKFERELRKLSREKQYEALLRIKGIGKKVANCIMLYGLHDTQSFPIDVWIQRIIDTYYNGNLDHNIYGKYAGIVQQYMFYKIRRDKG